jgi:hypothetical protein
MVTEITISEILFNTQGLFFRKVAYSRSDIASEMFQAEYTFEILTFIGIRK